jgi:hypothetical protein
MIRWLAAPTSAFVLAGCGLALTTEPRIENRCTTDADCSGSVCDVGLAMCVSPDPDPLRIGLEVTPPSAAGARSAATHSLGPYEIEGADDLGALPIPPSIMVIGTVRVPGEAEPIGASIRFSRPGAFVGARRIHVETTTAAVSYSIADQEVDYQTELVADAEYTITVTPVGEWAGRLPPLRFPHTIGGGGDIYPLPIEYPSDLVELKGLVVNSMELPAMGRTVWAIDAESGRRVSSTVLTSSEADSAGQFTLKLLPSTEGFLIRIGTGEDMTSPTIYADPDYLILDDEGLVRILVPMIQPVCYRASVELGNTRRPAVGATITFRTDEVLDPETGLSGTFETMLTAQEDGTFEASLLPGNYEVLVTPPGDHEVALYGVLSETRLLPADGVSVDCIQGQLFMLPERAAVGGTVLTGDERQMRDAAVTATALGRALEELSAARFNRTGQTTTDPTGQFNLPLDIGVYDLFIKPPSESNFPWVVRPDLVVGSSERSYSGEYEVTAPIPVTGTLTAHPGAEVRAYAVITDESGIERNVAVGRAVVQADGAFRLLLPSRL